MNIKEFNKKIKVEFIGTEKGIKFEIELIQNGSHFEMRVLENGKETVVIKDTNILKERTNYLTFVLNYLTTSQKIIHEFPILKKLKIN